MLEVSDQELAKLTDEEVLFFIRIRGKESYFNMFYPDWFRSKLSGLSYFRTISEYKKDADVYIDLNNVQYESITTEELSFFNNFLPTDEIIKRCRGLREISYFEAKDLIYRCAKFFLDYYKKSELKLIMTGCVDNYVMDVMCRLAKKFDIKCLAITDFFLYPDYKLVTLYGEHNNFYSPRDEEIEKIYNDLVGKKPSPLAISSSRSFKNAIYDFLSYQYRYLTRYLFRYKFKGLLNYEFRFAPYFRKFYHPKQLLVFSYFDKVDLKSIAKDRENFVYIPLHYFPEATVDYWTENPDNATYYHHLFEVIKFFEEKDIKVLVKEHPAFFPGRPLEIIKRLKKYSNVVLLSPFIKTQSILDCIDNVIVWNGSTGIESIMTDKVVYVTTEGYYSNNKLTHYKEFGKGRPFTADEKRELIKYVLQTSINCSQ